MILKPVSKDFELKRVDTNDACGLVKETAGARLTELSEKLSALQTRLYAEGKQSLLVVLQAMDTGGKDGAIRKVFGPLNAIGTHVVAFGKPTEHELAHDFLWRIHAHTPARGNITVFNRSHYEDVLVVRVHGWVDEPTVKQRFKHIAAFERMLGDRGTKVVKFFLHISKDEQKKRLQERLDDPTKRWKFNTGDLDERRRWDAYMHAFEEVMVETSTADCPWYVVPADRKWARDVMMCDALVHTLEAMNPQFPEPSYDYRSIVVE